tara:strand:+ start:133 stop:570 length:438 start_codon:yes stop_codon:yes gene_type:complete
MCFKNPGLNDVKECFRQQVSKLDLSEAINHISTHPEQYKYLSFSIQIPTVDALAVLEQYGKNDTFQYYWEKPVDQFAIAAAGSIKRIQTTGSDRFRNASSNGKELLRQVYHISNLKHHLASVHLLGGFSFFDHNVGKEWREFGAG